MQIHIKYVQYKFMNITYDPIKNKINLQKHQIDLADIEGIFYDDRALTIEDRDHDHDEERFETLGMGRLRSSIGGGVYYRDEDEIRVISARSAEPHERRTYEG